MKIKFMELMALKQEIIIHPMNHNALKKLLIIGEENLEENGVELLKKIKLIRGFTDQEICQLCAVKKDLLHKVLNGHWNISKSLAGKLSKLGYSEKAFLKKDGCKAAKKL